MRVFRSEEGFTLIELMIVIAIIAILAAVALTQYNAYKRKAKAKELVGFARACAQEIASQCEVEVNSVNVTDLESCNYNGTTDPLKYIHNLKINVTNKSGDAISCDNTNFNVVAIGKVQPVNINYESVCEVNGYTHSIECKGVYKQ